MMRHEMEKSRCLALALASVVFTWAVFVRNPDSIRGRISRSFFVGCGEPLYLELRTHLYYASLVLIYLRRPCVVFPRLPHMDEITKAADLCRSLFDRAAGAWTAFNGDSHILFLTFLYPSPGLPPASVRLLIILIVAASPCIVVLFRRARRLWAQHALSSRITQQYPAHHIG